MKPKIKVFKSKHIKGNYSVSNPSFILTNTNNIISSYQNQKKSNRAKTNSKKKKSVKKSNNKSFILRRKNNKEIDDINIKLFAHNTLSKTKKTSKNQSKNFFKIERKNPFHARIRSLQINYRDKNYLYYNNSANQTHRSNFKEKGNSSINKKINSFIQRFDEESNNNEFAINNNRVLIKTNSPFEDNESTKNTKTIEQKLLNFDNYSCDNKLVILGKNNQTITIKDKEKDINENKKLKNRVLKNGSFKNTANRNKNKTIIKTKDELVKKICTTSREYNDKNKGRSPLLKSNEKKLLSLNIVQKIKDKIHLIKTTIEDNYNSARNKSNADISHNHAKFSGIKNKKNNNNYFKLEKKFNFSNKDNSPVSNNRSLNRNKLLGSNNNPSYKNNNFKKKLKVYNIYNRNLKKLNKEKDNINHNSISNLLFKKNNNNNSYQENKRLHFQGNKSQKDLNKSFIEKSLNEENNNKPKYNKTKKPKDLSEKTIEKIETICQKGFLGADTTKINQDNFFIYKNFIDNPNYTFFGVCDGHGTYGHDVSGYLVYNIPLTINDLLIKNNYKTITDDNIPNLISLLKTSYVQMDDDLPKETDIDTTFSGSTCVSLIYTPSKLICANVGDSRCIIGKYNEKYWSFESLSFDHKPDSELEKERILNNRGRIETYVDDNGQHYGPQRVWLRNGNVPGLAMSRSFGDMVAHSVGVISEPEIIEYSMLEEDKFIILASDGIWEFITNKECVDFVKDYYFKKDIKGAINCLYKEATKRWILKEEVIDDITLIIIFLK
jgi:serine/threonine protein phosphatase PrpC